MKDAIIKEYKAFQSAGYKTWGNNTPMVQVITNDGEHWTHLDFTLEEAERAVKMLQSAIEEAKNEPDHEPSPWDDTPF
jgi:hypothetical protein